MSVRRKKSEKDLEAHRVVDLLPERTSEPVTTWMAERASPEIVCRDRGGAYADAARCKRHF